MSCPFSVDFRRTSVRRVASVSLLLVALWSCGPGDAPAGYYFFPIAEGTAVDIALTTVDHEPDTSLSMKVGDVLLSAAGQSARLGVAVEELHTHPEWLATIPGGTDPEQFAFSLAFTLVPAGDTPYTASEPYTVTFALLDGGPEEPEESEILLGATGTSDGQLAAQYDFDEPIALYYDQCIGGAGPDCLGGVVLYSSPNPGFAPRE